jgi:hypothetical protein
MNEVHFDPRSSRAALAYLHIVLGSSGAAADDVQVTGGRSRAP